MCDCRGKSTVILPEENSHSYSSDDMRTCVDEMIMKRNAGIEEVCEVSGYMDGVLLEREAGPSALTTKLPGLPQRTNGGFDYLTISIEQRSMLHIWMLHFI